MSKRKPSPQETCFLSEFNRPGLRWMIDHPWMLAGVVAGWALLVLLLGDQIGANAMAIYYTASLTASGEHVSATAANMYGHLSTANSGPYYLLIAPVLVLLAHRFHLAAGEAFIQLEERGILRSAKEPWHTIIQRRSRRVGLATIWLFIPIFIYCVWFKQFPSLDASAAGLPVVQEQGQVLPNKNQKLTHLGYVQSPNHHLWVNGFHSLTTQEGKLAVIEAQEISMSEPLSLKLFAELERLNLLGDPKLNKVLDFRGGKPVALRLKDAVAGEKPLVTLSAENVWPMQPRVRLGKITDYFQSLMNTRERAEMERRAYISWFKTFVVLDQLRIAALFTFMAWLLGKFTFYLVQLYLMLPDGTELDSRKPLYLKPWSRDGQNRFGLGDLFRPYNLLVLCIGVGSFYFALNFPDGGGIKAITQASGAGSGTTRVVHLATVSLGIAGMLIGPLWLYPRRLRQWLEVMRLQPLRLRQAQIREKRKKDPQEAEKEWIEITKEEAEILSQTTWPKGDRSFQLSVAVIFTVLVLPLGVAGDFLPEGMAKYSRLPQYLRAKCKEVAAEFYGLYHQGGTRNPASQSSP